MSYDEYITPISIGDYTVRLITNANELDEYQKLRYKYLLREFNPALADAPIADLNGGYDAENSQLCVFYTHPETKKQQLVGGYILMRFKYESSFCKSGEEFDISGLVKVHRREILETSRAVVHAEHRNGIVLKLLWDGIYEYTQKYNLRYIIGTVSFKGVDPNDFCHAISYLFHNYLMPPETMVTGTDSIGLLDPVMIDKGLVREQLPPILRGYLMQGSQVGQGLYIDREFKSVDVFVIMDVEKRGKYRLK